MEFKSDCERALDCQGSSDGIAILDSSKYQKFNHPIHSSSMNFYQKNLCDILDKMGEASAKAQGLGSVITTAQKFFASENQRLYIKVDQTKVLGLLKVGVKNLFIRSCLGSLQEIKPLCVLDFYVHESVQRLGIGKELFEKMMICENKQALELGYDRPSPKLLAFLSKHYGLKSYSPQANNYVVFNEYFKTGATTPQQSNRKQQKENIYSDKKQELIDKWESQLKLTESPPAKEVQPNKKLQPFNSKYEEHKRDPNEITEKPFTRTQQNSKVGAQTNNDFWLGGDNSTPKKPQNYSRPQESQSQQVSPKQKSSLSMFNSTVKPQQQRNPILQTPWGQYDDNPQNSRQAQNAKQRTEVKKSSSTYGNFLFH